MPSPLTPEQRSQRARIAAYAMHAKHNADETTAPARKAFLESFVDKVDPDRTLPEAERERRAEYARKGHFARLAYLSAKKRAANKAADR